MSWVFYLPFFVQALVIGFDEFYFHLRRGLPKWERLGHPIDTLSIVACFSFVLLFPYTKTFLLIYIALAVFSCLLVTKDEFVHKEHCPAQEQWLHALLFINHPLVLICMGWMWKQGTSYQHFLTLQLGLAVFFGLYQLLYWNFVWKEKP